jgi:hypothetical protein
MVLKVFSDMICGWAALLRQVFMASRNYGFIAKSDIMFLGRLEYRF